MLLSLTVKHTAKESESKACEMFKFWSFLWSKSVNNVCKLLRLLDDMFFDSQCRSLQVNVANRLKSWCCLEKWASDIMGTYSRSSMGWSVYGSSNWYLREHRTPAADLTVCTVWPHLIYSTFGSIFSRPAEMWPHSWNQQTASKTRLRSELGLYRLQDDLKHEVSIARLLRTTLYSAWPQFGRGTERFRHLLTLSPFHRRSRYSFTLCHTGLTHYF